MSRMYCVVYGCLNSSCSHPELSFFKLPADAERRAKWLRVISREDLQDKPPQNYTVCDIHFNSSDILIGTKRRRLKTNSIPALHLPDLNKKDTQTQTTDWERVEVFTQTDLNVTFSASVGTQTPKYLTKKTLPKKKIKSDPLQIKKNKKISVIDNKSAKYQLSVLQKLCDKFLTKELAGLVKSQTNC